MIEIGSRFIEGALLDFHVCFGLMQGCHCLVEIGLRGSLPGEKFLGASGIYFGKLERGPCVGQIALSLSNRCLKKRRVDLGDYLAGFHLGIKIYKQLCDISRNLASYLHINDRIERARRGNSLGNGAARNSCSLIICGTSLEALPKNSSDNQQPYNDCKPRDKTFHSSDVDCAYE
jgi:hypothetical protein